MTTTASALRRRSLLSAGLLGLLSACGTTPARPGAAGRPGQPATLDPDALPRDRAVRATTALAARYDAVLAAYPAAAGTLRPLRAELTAQLAALTRPLPGTAPTTSSTGAPTGSPTATGPTGTPAADPSTGTPVTVPGTRAAALAALGTAEQGTAQARYADLATVSPPLARLLAALAANGAQHAVLLGAGAPAAPPVPAPAAAPLPASALAALQATLSAEDAAVYAYGVIGAQLSGARRARADAAYQAHRDRRGALQQRIAAAGAVPVAAAAAYQLPSPVSDPASAVRLAALVEQRICAVHANAVQATAGPLRGAMAAALQQSALDALTWRGSGTALPGLADG
ncbi:ferritin-like domain-containing protein [Streptacidiphilus sp. EB129]|uniref:ferritin-like domain-containing protein n=1 Tax=Streptacidiphilus sp. EB129 TaxID=3156262 RepID=UPI00351947CD